MKKLMLVLLLGGFLLTSCQKDDLSSQTELDAVAGKGKKKENNKKTEETSSATFDMSSEACEAVKVAELYAGQNTYVGTVSVESDGSNYTVTYQAIPGYCFSEIHFESTNVDDGFSLKGNGNPNPGGMDYKRDDLGCESSWTFTVPDQGSYLAAHAVVNCTANTLDALPTSTSFETKTQGTNSVTGSYFDIVVEGFGEEIYGAWCVDTDKSLLPGTIVENAKVYNSLGGWPEDLFENPQNMFVVNWILNNLDSDLDLRSLYTYGEIQIAIWTLLDDETSTGGVGPFDPEKAQELSERALEEGVGYVPDCGDLVGVIVVPVDENHIVNKQSLIFAIPLECRSACDETAWARNSATSNNNCGNFPGANWATYFKYDDSE